MIGDRRMREQIARIVRDEIRQALETLLPAAVAAQQSTHSQQPQQSTQIQQAQQSPQPPPAQPAPPRRLRLGRPLGSGTLNAGGLNAPVPGNGAAAPAPLAGGTAQGAAAGGAPAGNGPAAALTGPQLLQEMEANLLRLRQVIRETQALAERMEQFLDGDARSRFAGSGRPRRRQRNPF